MAMIAELLAQALHHHRAGDWQEAEDLYRQILLAEPAHADAQHLMGVLASQVGRHDLAITCIRQALALGPPNAIFHSNLALAYQADGRLDEAVAQFQEALRLRPGHAEAHYNLGNVLQAQGKHAEAIAHYEQALRLQPDSPQVHNNLGNALHARGKPDEAVAHFRQALYLLPDSAEVRNNLGNALLALGELDEVVAVFQQAARLKPDFAEVHNNLGNVLQLQGKLDEAVAEFQHGLRLRPAYAEAHNNLGTALQALGQPGEALGHYEQALGLSPDFAGAHWNRALVWLLLGNFEHGWRGYEWRWRRLGRSPRSLPRPLWDGSPLAGRTILLHAESSVGDTLQFIRYAPFVKKFGGRVIVECQESLVPLLAASPLGIDGLVAAGSPLPEFDVHAPLLSLPGILGTSLSTVPGDNPYLSPDAGRVERWRNELGPSQGFKIGIAWEENPHERDRSIALAHFVPLARAAGVRLFSLQKGPGAEQLNGVAGNWEVADLGSRFDEVSGAFMDTAAVMKGLDLVVCSDSALAHLAGALGVPVWVALPFAPDWRWLLDREDSPWYPSMRLFRQVERGNWAEVFERMAGALWKMLAAEASVARLRLSKSGPC